MANDILNSLANLSNDEIFTSAKVVNIILDRIPEDFWKEKNKKILNPFMKTGIFLREIIVRFYDGLKSTIPNDKKRLEHILKNMVFGIPITNLTSLISRRTIYTSKDASNKFSLGENIFSNTHGNVYFTETKHLFKKSKCKICGISKKNYNDEFENYAYPFIHKNDDWKKVQKMTFDLIIGNPPYQLKDGEGGGGASAKPIYQLFVNEALKMNPDHLLMIIPSRWYGGGKGLDKFRKEMFDNNNIKELHDFENAKVLFPSIQLKGGVCFFYIEKHFSGKTKLFTYKTLNKYDEFTIDSINSKINDVETNMFIRNQFALKILNKVWKKKYPSLEKTISSRRPFGIQSNEIGYQKIKSNADLILVGRNNSRTFISINDKRLINTSEINKFKVAIPKAIGNAIMSDKVPNAIIIKPGEIVTETYLIKTFNIENEAKSFVSYLKTNIFRFLFNSLRYSHNTTKSSYRWIPELKWNCNYTDEILMKKFNISKKEFDEILCQLGEKNE